MTSSNGNIFRVTGHLYGEFTGHRWIFRTKPVTRSFDVFFDLRLNKRLSKQSWNWWFETPLWPLWRHRNEISIISELLFMLFHSSCENVMTWEHLWRCDIFFTRLIWAICLVKQFLGVTESFPFILQKPHNQSGIVKIHHLNACPISNLVISIPDWYANLQT